jgi:hypothetical protein
VKVSDLRQSLRLDPEHLPQTAVELLKAAALAFAAISATDCEGFVLNANMLYD